MHSVRAPVCSAVLLCVFDITHVHCVQHWYCCNAVFSFSEHTYLPSCGALGHLLGQEHSVLFNKTLCLLNRAVTASLRCYQKLNRAVEISMHYTAVFKLHYLYTWYVNRGCKSIKYKIVFE